MNEGHPFFEGLVVVHDGSLRDSVAPFFDQRFHDERELESLRRLDLSIPWKDTELRNLNPVVGQNLLRQRLVAGKEKPSRVAAGIGSALKLQVPDDVRVENRLSVELLEKVEHDVRLESLNRPTERCELVAQADHHDFVAKCTKTLADLELRLERRDLLVGKVADVIRGHETFVCENDDSPPLYSGCHVSRRCRRCTVCTVNMMAKSSFVCRSPLVSRSLSSRHRPMIARRTWSMVN